MSMWTEIRRRVLTGQTSKRAICREYNIHWDTLQRILQHEEPPGYRQKRLSPEQLFAAAGFNEDSVDDFYAELRAAVQAGHINEERPNNRDVYFEAASK